MASRAYAPSGDAHLLHEGQPGRGEGPRNPRPEHAVPPQRHAVLRLVQRADGDRGWLVDKYYRCSNHLKRGTCKNASSVREDVARASVLGELRHKLLSPSSTLYARKRVAERLGELERARGSKLGEGKRELVNLEEQIGRLVDFVAEGQASPAIATRLKELEAKTVIVRRAVIDLEQASAGPIALPSPDDMVRLTLALERRLTSDVTKGREELRRLFKDGRIELLPQEGGFYVAKSELLPLVLLTAPPPEEAQGGGTQR